VTKTHIITLNHIHPIGGKQVGLPGKAIGLIGETRRSHGDPLVVEVGLYVEIATHTAKGETKEFEQGPSSQHDWSLPDWDNQAKDSL
jgi:hypothetical protein